MKRHVLIFFVSLFILTSCSSDKQYPVKINEENGVKIISNPNYPREGVYDLVTEELYTLGKDEDNNKYLLGAPQDIKLAPNGNLYLMDGMNCKMLVFDKAGNYLRTFGKLGKGPGDFCAPVYFRIISDNSIWFNDACNTRISILDSLGKYLDGTLYTGFNYYMEMDSRNNIYTYEPRFNDKEITDQLKPVSITKVIKRFNSSSKQWSEIGTFKGEQFAMMGSGNTTTSSRDLVNEFIWRVSPDDFLITAFAGKYEFSKYDLTGKLVMQMGRDFSPFANRDYDESKNQKRYYEPLTRFNLFDDNGNFWVNLNNGKNPDEYIYDIFSKDGVFIKQVHSKFRIKILKNNIAYSIVLDKSAPVLVKALKYSLKKRENK